MANNDPVPNWDQVRLPAAYGGVGSATVGTGQNQNNWENGVNQTGAVQPPMELLRILAQGQQQRQQNFTNMRSREVRRTMGGGIVDENAPTGIDWLKAHGSGEHSWDEAARRGGQTPFPQAVPQPQAEPNVPELLQRQEPAQYNWLNSIMNRPKAPAAPEQSYGSAPDFVGPPQPAAEETLNKNWQEYSPLYQPTAENMDAAASSALHHKNPGMLPYLGRAATLGGAALYDQLMNKLWRGGDAMPATKSAVDWIKH